MSTVKVLLQKVGHRMTFYPETQIINLSGHFWESHPMTDTRHFIIDMTLASDKTDVSVRRETRPGASRFYLSIKLHF